MRVVGLPEAIRRAQSVPVTVEHLPRGAGRPWWRPWRRWRASYLHGTLEAHGPSAATAEGALRRDLVDYFLARF